MIERAIESHARVCVCLCVCQKGRDFERTGGTGKEIYRQIFM